MQNASDCMEQACSSGCGTCRVEGLAGKGKGGATPACMKSELSILYCVQQSFDLNP